MTEKYFDARQDRPYGRACPVAMRCPYCGEKNVFPAWADDETDRVRIEFYCDNQGCDTREYIVLAKRVGFPLERRDLAALDRVDAPAADRESLSRGVSRARLRFDRDAMFARRRRRPTTRVTPGEAGQEGEHVGGSASHREHRRESEES